MKTRCAWAGQDPLYIAYHDEEWGRPQYNDQKLFEMLCLEGAQAGLSWITVLRKRARYREVFDQFDARKIACYDDAKRRKLLSDAGIIRNKLKVNAFIINAQCYLKIKQQTSFSNYLWQFVDGKPVINHWADLSQVPTTTSQSDAMAKQLKQDGFKFVGSTICYALMQACGMVNDHTRDCFLASPADSAGDSDSVS